MSACDVSRGSHPVAGEHPDGNLRRRWRRRLPAISWVTPGRVMPDASARGRICMKGVVFVGDRKLELRDFPDPTPGPRDVVLEIKASGMCGSDLHVYRASFKPGDTTLGIQARRRAGDRRTRALRHRRCGRHRGRAERGARRPAGDGSPLHRLRRLQALPLGLGADVPRRLHRVRRERQRRACQIHEGSGSHARAAARCALVRDRRGDLLRHRHGLRRAEAAQSAGRRDDRDLRPGAGGSLGDAARRRDGRARDRARRFARAAANSPAHSARTKWSMRAPTIRSRRSAR